MGVKACANGIDVLISDRIDCNKYNCCDERKGKG